MAAFNIKTTAEEVANALANQIRGRNVIVTGVTKGGLGAESARVIAKHASMVVLAGRNQQKLEDTAKDIRASFPNANLRELLVDLGSFKSVRKAAAEVNSYKEPIHVLINNAAILGTPYTLSVDGFESQLATNHFGHFLFTSLVFPKLVSSASTANTPSRIVNVSSSGHRDFPLANDDPKTWFRYFEDVNCSEGKTYNKWVGYGRSKLANVLFSNELARRIKDKDSEGKIVPVLTYSLHPGAILTNLGDHLDKEELKAMGVMDEHGNWLMEWKTLGAGSATQIVAAFDPSLADKNGAYLEDSNIASPAPHADPTNKDVQDLAQKLWDFTETSVGERFPL